MLEKDGVQKMSDDSLDAVSGGTFLGLESKADASQVTYVFQVGDIVDVKCMGFTSVRCRITKLGTESDIVSNPGGVAQNVFVDTYYCEKLDSNPFFLNGWKDRDQIVMAGR